MFSFADYKEIIRIIKESGRACNFRQAQEKDKFIMLQGSLKMLVTTIRMDEEN